VIDTHTHIYLDEFDEDREAMVERARQAGVKRLILPAIDGSTHEKMIRVEGSFPGCYAMMGLHPCSVKEDFGAELDQVETWLEKRHFVAIGEIGLDFYWDKTFEKQQYEAFHHQVDLALTRNLPIVIHSRDAIDEAIEVVRQYTGLRGVFHCFSGNYEQAVRIMDTGFYLGIGGVVTFKNSGLDKVVEKTGLSKVILETDAPYLAPVPFRGKRNEPAYIKLVAEKLAFVCGRSFAEVEELTTENALQLFKL
jgi:TatD DNase family protein